jgi:multidrug efflux system outer membrane protein
MIQLRFLIFALPLCSMLSGCQLGPDPTIPPETIADDAAGFFNAPPEDGLSEYASASSLRWWEGFADPTTSSLVEEAISSNHDLRLAAARVMESLETWAIARGGRLPQVEYGLSASRTKNSFVLPNVGRTSTYSTTYATDLSAAFQLDLFGRLARTQQAAWAELLASEANRRTIMHTMVAEVVRARIRVATLQRQLELAERTFTSWESTLSVVEDRYRSGLVDAEDLYLSRQSYASAKAAIPEIQQQLTSARLGLDVLLGRRPGSSDYATIRLPEEQDFPPVPPGLPAGLLDARPDLLAARYAIASNQARVGAALANLLPDLRLTGSAGNRSDDLADLLSADTLIYNLAGNLAGPLFNGGQRRAELRRAKARLEQALQSYAGDVLQALREVEDALNSETMLREQFESRQEQFESARAAEELSRTRYNSGTGNILQLLVADRSRVNAELALISAQQAIWNARVTLHVALGGAWIAEEEVPLTDAVAEMASGTPAIVVP